MHIALMQHVTHNANNRSHFSLFYILLPTFLDISTLAYSCSLLGDEEGELSRLPAIKVEQGGLIISIIPGTMPIFAHKLKHEWIPSYKLCMYTHIMAFLCVCIDITSLMQDINNWRF